MQSLTLQSLSSFSWKNSCCYFSKLWNVNTPPDNWKCIGILVLAALGWWKKPGYEDKSTRVHENHTTYQAMAQWRKFFLFSLLHKFHSLIKKKKKQRFNATGLQCYCLSGISPTAWEHCGGKFFFRRQGNTPCHMDAIVGNSSSKRTVKSLYCIRLPCHKFSGQLSICGVKIWNRSRGLL